MRRDKLSANGNRTLLTCPHCGLAAYPPHYGRLARWSMPSKVAKRVSTGLFVAQKQCALVGIKPIGQVIPPRRNPPPVTTNLPNRSRIGDPRSRYALSRNPLILFCYWARTQGAVRRPPSGWSDEKGIGFKSGMRTPHRGAATYSHWNSRNQLLLPTR